MKNKEIRDCHYCAYAVCLDENSFVDCCVEDGCYFDHQVEDSVKEAQNCDWFEYDDYFPKT